jgi:hypothetical protein
MAPIADKPLRVPDQIDVGDSDSAIRNEAEVVLVKGVVLVSTHCVLLN